MLIISLTNPISFTRESVRTYYDQNTRFFLAFSSLGKAQNIAALCGQMSRKQLKAYAKDDESFESILESLKNMACMKARSRRAARSTRSTHYTGLYNGYSRDDSLCVWIAHSARMGRCACYRIVRRMLSRI